MATQRVGIREFRAGLAEYIDSDAPIAITRHGQTVGYFIPTRADRTAPPGPAELIVDLKGSSEQGSDPTAPGCISRPLQNHRREEGSPVSGGYRPLAR